MRTLVGFTAGIAGILIGLFTLDGTGSAIAVAVGAVILVWALWMQFAGGGSTA
jgi:hypothetical protein